MKFITVRPNYDGEETKQTGQHEHEGVKEKVHQESGVIDTINVDVEDNEPPL